MQSPIFAFAGAASSLSTTVTEYAPLQGPGAQWGARTLADTPVAVSGTISKLYVELTPAPGTPASGKSWTYTLFKNGSATALTCTVSDDGTSSNDTSNSVSVTAGDLLSWEQVPAGTPTAWTQLTIGALFTSTTTRESNITLGSGSSLTTGSTTYSSIQAAGGAYTATQANAATMISPPGVIDSLRVSLSGTPGGSATYAFTLYKNGSATSLTCTVASGATTASDTDAGHAVTVAAGDNVSIEIVPASTPTARALNASLRFTATTNGESMVAGSGVPSSSTNRYFAPMSSMGTGLSSDTIGNKNKAAVAYVVKNLYTAFDVAPGAAKSRNVRAWKNTGAGTVVATVTGAVDTTGNNTGNTDSFAVGDYFGFVTDSTSGSAALTWWRWGATAYITP